MKNRRNYYRLLHVQRDAPLAIIKSSYHAMMLNLRQHPDLGGDHEVATLLNEAYSVLTDAERRAAYDRELAETAGPGRVRFQDGPQRAEPPAKPQPTPSSASACAFCGAPFAQPLASGDRCRRCGSPLAHPLVAGHGSDGKRSMPRFTRGGEVTLLPQRGPNKMRAVIHDLSPQGMCVVSQEPLAVNQVVRLEGATLSAVARVVSCRRDAAAAPNGQLVGLEFLALEFSDARGSVVNLRT